MTYSDHFAKHLRLVLLRTLDEAPGYSANASILAEVTRSLGLPSTRDQVETALAWLAEQQLLTREELPFGVTVVTATQRGLDVARGLAIVPGVQRPNPKS